MHIAGSTLSLVATSAGFPAAAEDRLRNIQAITDAALAHLDVEDLLDELLDRVREILEVDTAAVLLLDPSGQQLVATAASGLEEEIRQGTRLPVGKGFAGRVAAEQRPVIIEDVAPANVLNPLLLDKGLRSLLGVPLVAPGSPLGVLHVGTLVPRRFTDGEVELLQLAADRAATAVQSLATRPERAAARELQRGLLPSALPAIPRGREWARPLRSRRGNRGGPQPGPEGASARGQRQPFGIKISRTVQRADQRSFAIAPCNRGNPASTATGTSAGETFASLVLGQ